MVLVRPPPARIIQNMGITLILALICVNAQAQTSTPATQPVQKPAKPLYYQMTQNSDSETPSKAQADAMAKARATLMQLSAAGMAAVGAPSSAPAQTPTTTNRLPSSDTTPSNPEAMEIVHPASNSKPPSADSPTRTNTTPEEEKAALYLQDQSKKMQEALKDMELSN